MNLYPQLSSWGSFLHHNLVNYIVTFGISLESKTYILNRLQKIHRPAKVCLQLSPFYGRLQFRRAQKQKLNTKKIWGVRRRFLAILWRHSTTMTKICASSWPYSLPSFPALDQQFAETDSHGKAANLNGINRARSSSYLSFLVTLKWEMIENLDGLVNYSDAQTDCNTLFLAATQDAVWTDEMRPRRLDSFDTWQPLAVGLY